MLPKGEALKKFSHKYDYQAQYKDQYELMIYYIACFHFLLLFIFNLCFKLIKRCNMRS